MQHLMNNFLLLFLNKKSFCCNCFYFFKHFILKFVPVLFCDPFVCRFYQLFKGLCFISLKDQTIYFQEITAMASGSFINSCHLRSDVTGFKYVTVIVLEFAIGSRSWGRIAIRKKTDRDPAWKIKHEAHDGQSVFFRIAILIRSRSGKKRIDHHALHVWSFMLDRDPK